MSDQEEVLTLEEAAKAYKTSVMTLRRKIYAKLIPASKAFGKTLIKRKDLENFLKKVPA